MLGRPLPWIALLLTASLAPMAHGVESDYEFVELRAPPPAWWTPEIEEAAAAAGRDGQLLNPLTGERVTPVMGAPLGGIPAGAPDYLFIRPGALFLAGGGLCTYNFIYGAGTKIGTAGHCVSSVGQTVSILAAPSVPLLGALGTVSAFRNGGVGDDWALIDVFPHWHEWVDPNMAYLGGPSCSAWAGQGGNVKSVGHGVQTGLAAAVPRVSTAGASNGNSFSGIGLVSGGDSGSPVIQNSPLNTCPLGTAAGIITHCAAIVACLPLYAATDIRRVPATVTTGFDPI